VSGVAVEKIFFQPTVNIDLAISQIVSASNAIRALMPTGIQPPVIVQYNASSVPVLQLSLSSDQLNEQQLYDYGIYRIRQALAPIPGITLPTPYGGKYRQIMIDIDPNALAARGITPNDIVNAVNAQSLTLPSGDAKMGDTQFIVRVNNMAPSMDAPNRIPIKQAGGTTVYLSDVAHVRDGWAVQQNVVRTDGKRSVLLTIIKNGNASTLDVVNKVKAALPEIRRAAPPGMKIDLLFDQSIFVSNAISGVLQEGAIAAGLTALMILLFLGSWRSMLVVMVAIPLSIMTSIAVLAALGQTINTMTLCAGGRHIGRRQHGHDRKHASSFGGKKAFRRGGFGRCRRHRGPDVDLDARDLLRVRFCVLLARRGALSFHADGDGGGVCHACFLCHFADPHTDHDRFALAHGA
jgi:multidrug efflux pump subunit AcrB